MAKSAEHDGEARNTDNTYTRGIAQFVAGLSYDKIPPEVIERVKLLILDSLGCAIYGSSKEHCKIVIDTICKIDSSKGCGIWGTNKRVSVPHAALVNGTLIQSFELDDVHRKAAMHVGATTLPGLFAVAETRPGLNGKQLLAAAVAGYEVGPRVGACMGPDLLGQGWHSGAVVGVYAGAASAASAMRLSEEQTLNALGIAGTQASGLMAAQYGAMVKRMHHGKAAQSGVYGALLAENGFTGIQNVFESSYGGFCTAFSGSKDNFKLPELTRDFGKTWETMGVALKFYSAAGSNHTTLDAIQIMRERHPFTPDQVEKVVVHGSQVTKDHIFWPYEPAGTTNAQMCMPYVVATLLLEGAFMVDQVRDDMLADPERIALSRKVDFIAEPEITKMGLRYYVRVEIFLKDGTRLEETLEAQRGSETRFASAADVIGKFENLSKVVFGAKQIAAIHDAILNLEKLDDTSKLVSLLAAK